MTKRFQYAVVTGSTCLLGVLLLGIVMGRGNAAEGAYKHFSVFTEVISRIKSDYVEEPDMKNVTLGAMNGLLESVDPYASYLNADQYKQYLKTKETAKGVTGLSLSRRFGYVGVVAAVPGSPGAKEGLETGDVLETIAGVATRDMPLAYAEMLLMGEPGSTVDITVLRARRGAEAQKVTLTRALAVKPPVTANTVADGIARITVPVLDAGRTGEVAAKVREAERDGARKLVLDLRGNASGSPEEGLALANLFLEKGSLGTLQGQKVAKKEFQADPAKVVSRLPLVILANRGTSGGAELAASALLDNKRAEVVGERTYGDAAMRKALTLEDGSAVILSVAKYMNAAGKAIQDNGVIPSLGVAGVEPDSDDDDDAPAQPQAQPQKPAEDQQLKKAIEVLNLGLAAAKKSTESAVASRPAGATENIQPGTLGVPRPK
ncbi:MAG: carboxyl-terminal protease [Acidobacteria bacterium]|nr:carboxyl-terminal protease [Acidobacteriota bacterium]